MSFWVGIILSLVSGIGAYLLEGGNPLRLFGLGACLAVLFGTFFAVLAAFGPGEMLAAWKSAFRKKGEAPSEKAARVWDLAEKLSYAFGVLGLLLGAVLILSHVGGDMEKMGESVAVAIIAPIYGVALGILASVLRARC